METILIEHPEPYIRYVNNYRPTYSYTEKERIIFDHELMYVMNGEVEMHYDGQIFTLKRGNIFYLQPGILNYITVEESKHFRTHCIHFDWIPPAPEDDFTAEEFYMHSVLSPDYHERLERLRTRPCYEPLTLPLPSHITNAPYEKLSPLFAKCYQNFTESTPLSRLRLKAAFWEILAALGECTLAAQKSRPAHPQILYAMEFLRSNYTANYSVPYLAEKYGLSPKYFGTLFKACAGKSVGDFVLDLRIYAAKEMLLGSNLPIEEIAERVGFQNSFYFSKCFKMREKISPSGYRSLMRQ